jgi:hypothetical protein
MDRMHPLKYALAAMSQCALKGAFLVVDIVGILFRKCIDLLNNWKIR